MVCDDFRTNVIALLEKRGMSRSDLARAMDVSPQFVTQLLNGARDPGLALVEKVADAFGVDVTTLVKKIKHDAPTSAALDILRYFIY